jgi:NTE family protein
MVEGQGEARPILSTPRVGPRTVGVVAGLGVFMAFLDNTVVGIAYPNLLASFPHAGIDGLSWVLNAYTIVFAALLVPAGRIADLLGRRRLFSAGIVLFTLASALCALAPTAAMLIAARALQGAGAAILIPASLALVLEANPGPSRVRAVTAWSATAVVAAGIGPSVGGFLVDLSNWRLVFLINIPIGLIAWRLSARKLVESHAPGPRGWPDLTGSLLLGIAVGGLVLAIVQTNKWGLVSPLVLTAFAAAAVGLVVLAHRSRRHPAPVVDLALLRRRTFAVTSGLTLLGSIGFYAAGLANLLYLMQVWRYSPLKAGLAFTPAPFVAAASAVLVGRRAAGRDVRPFLLAGSLLWAAAPLWLALRGTADPAFLQVYLPSAVVGALGIGLTFPVISDAAVADAPGGQFAAATALNTGIRELGAAIGIALCVALLGTPARGDVVPFERVWFFAAGCFALLAVAAVTSGRIKAASPPAPEAASDAAAAAPAPSGANGAGPSHNGARARRRPVPSDVSGEDAYAQSLDLLPSEVLAEAKRILLPAGEWLFRQGEMGEALYIVERGRVDIVAEPPGQDAELIRELGPGAVVGELALLSGAARSASLRARRDTTLLCVTRTDFEKFLKASPAFAHSLLRQLARRLENTRPLPARGRDPASVVALFTASRDEPCRKAVALFTTAFLAAGENLALDERVSAERLAEALEQAERSHAQVLLLAGAPGTAWATACARQADRAVVVLGDLPAPGDPMRSALPHDADIALAGRPGGAAASALLADIDARSSQRIRPGADGSADAAALARRVTGRSVGLVLSGGGARGFAHIGVIEELMAAGVAIDRVAGASMGAFVGALLASGLGPDEIDQRCYEEWVRRNPINDYRLPRVSLIRGTRVRAMLERLLPAKFEDLVRPFLCVSTDLIRADLVVHRRGDLPLAVGASMALPAFAPPVRMDNRLLFDGGVLDNLPVATMAADGEGPIIASDVGEPEDRHIGRLDAPERDPTLPETLYRLILLKTEDTLAAARQHAQLVILPERDGVGRLEFYKLDRMREQGRRAAARALETAPPELFGR